MSFAAYIQFQKSRIEGDAAQRRGGNCVLRREGEASNAAVCPDRSKICDSEQLLREINSLSGLNTKEREAYAALWRRNAERASIARSAV